MSPENERGQAAGQQDVAGGPSQVPNGEVQAAQQVQAASQGEPPKKKHTALIVVLVIVAVLVVGGLVSCAACNAAIDKSVDATERLLSAGSSEDPQAGDAQEPAETEAAPAEESGGVDENGVSVDLKEALDSYEAFFDEYVDFMKSYQDGGSDNALGMATDYLDWMSRYTETMDKMQGMDTSDMSAADYAYYVDVMARIEKKIADVVS